jgi:hypothetical protein
MMQNRKWHEAKNPAAVSRSLSTATELQRVGAAARWLRREEPQAACELMPELWQRFGLRPDAGLLALRIADK